jgi:integrase
LTSGEAARLIAAAKQSANRQLRFILALMMITRTRLTELLKARWEQIDLSNGLWTLPPNRSGRARQVVLTRPAIELLNKLTRWPDCPYLVPNPVTKKPYASITKGWEVALQKAELGFVEIDDLRFSDVCSPARQRELIELVCST